MMEEERNFSTEDGVIKYHELGILVSVREKLSFLMG